MKSPAINFYTSDFLTGTAFMSNKEVGAYIKLLSYQHQLGHLEEEKISAIIYDLDEKEKSNVLSKFSIDKNGKYFNKRMEFEITKKEKYSESRANNRKNKKTYEKDMKNICNSYEKHMENEKENININNLESNKGIVRGKEKTFIKPTVEEIREYCQERNNHINPNGFYDFYESKGWRVGNQSMKDWKACVRTWETKNKESVPEWFNKEIKKEERSEDEKRQIEAIKNGTYRPEDFDF